MFSQREVGRAIDVKRQQLPGDALPVSNSRVAHDVDVPALPGNFDHGEADQYNRPRRVEDGIMRVERGDGLRQIREIKG